ncbi:hypothetical protein ACSBR2_038633 [Camellia fascicularis]
MDAMRAEMEALREEWQRDHEELTREREERKRDHEELMREREERKRDHEEMMRERVELMKQAKDGKKTREAQQLNHLNNMVSQTRAMIPPTYKNS